MTIRKKEEMTEREIAVDLTGPDGNAFALMAYAKKWAKQLNLNWEEIQADMTSGDYDHLLEVLEENFGDYVVFYR